MGNRFGRSVRRSAMALALAVSAFSGSASAVLLVSDYLDPSVLMYNETTGAFEGTLIPAGSGGLTTAHGLVIGPDMNVYVAASSGAINRYSPSGAFLGVFTSGGPGINPINMVFGPDGNLYVSDYQASGAIMRFNG